MIDINKVYCENNLKTFARMPDDFLDMIITSPPYDDMDESFSPIPKRGLRQYEGYTWDFKKIAQESYRTLKQGGVMVWVVGDPTVNGSESLASSLQKVYFRKVGFNIHDTMIYQRSNAPLSHRRYEQEFEYMFVLTKGAPKTFNGITVPRKYKESKKRIKKMHRGQDGNYKPAGYTTTNTTVLASNIWHYPTGKGHSDDISFRHPASFPEQLANDHIISWSNEGDLIYDCFLGSGTMAKMAILNNRNFIGSEIAPEYTPIYERRIQDAYALVGKGPKITEQDGVKYISPPLFGQ